MRSTIVEPEMKPQVNTNIGEEELTDKPEMTRNGQSIMRRITWTYRIQRQLVSRKKEYITNTENRYECYVPSKFTC